MRIYTSYHAKAKALIEAGIQPISISVQFPKFAGKGAYPEAKHLAPTYAMLKMNWADYKIRFNEILAALNPADVVENLRLNSGGKDIAMLCYEKDENDCHRKIVATWLENHLDIEVDEYMFVKPEPKRPDGKQTSFFN